MPNPPVRILLTDADRFPVSAASRATIMELGAELLEVPYGISEDQLADVSKEVDAVLVSSPKLTSRVIEGMTRCKIIARCGIGYDNIDIQAAAKKGITVTYVPDYCVEEVSDHTIALMFDCWRKITYSHERVKSGHWDSYGELGEMRRIKGQTLGFLGFGRIAQAIARKLRTFGLKMIASDPNIDLTVMAAYDVERVSFDQLIRESDVLSLHAPLLQDTRHIINRQAIEQMKRGVILINTSRGKLVDEASLEAALQSGQVGAAGLDVFETEPPEKNSKLLGMKQVVFTPHSAAYSEEALLEVKDRAIEEIARNFKGLQPRFAVPAY